MVNIAVLGYGTVGSGVVEVINTNHNSINKRAGAEINIKYVLDLRDFPGDPVEKVLVHDYDVIANDPEVDIVVEVMGGIEPAYTFVKRALESGKSVCTSNKALVAKHGPELMEIAREKNINFLFEASCGGGIPIIRALNSSLTADEIDEITGILNGTTNYMMYKMSTEGCEFDTVLKEAQAKGYAEADPTADVEGYDACRKIAILSSLAYGKFLNYEDIYTEGITKITAKDIKYAKEMGCDIKLLGVAKNTEEGIEAYVCPMLIPSNHPLATVNDSYNAVFVNGDAVENAMFYGRGAGELPTASAVVGDAFEIARNIKADCCGRIGCTCYKEIPVKKMADTHNRYFMRLIVEDRCGVLAEMTAVFAKYGVSVAQIIQKAARAEGSAEVVVITAQVREGDFRTAMEELSGRSSVRKISSMLRVYGE